MAAGICGAPEVDEHPGAEADAGSEAGHLQHGGLGHNAGGMWAGGWVHGWQSVAVYWDWQPGSVCCFILDLYIL